MLVRAAVLVSLAVVPLLPTLRATFVYDDTTIIRDNLWLRGWGALVRVWEQPYWPSEGGVDALGLYRPLHIALLSTVWNAGGGSARWFHIYALALSALTVLAVWWLLGHATRVTAAFVAAAWFATHPLEEDRIVDVKALIATYDAATLRTLATDSRNFQSFKTRLKSLPPSPRPRA